MSRTVVRNLRFSIALPTFALCLLLASLLPSRAQTTTPSPLVLEGLGRATIPLDGLWQFHTGDDPSWALPAFDDSRWETLQAGVPWDAQGHWGYTGFAWYRRQIQFAPGTPDDLNLHLFLPTVDSACDVYWNGQRIGGIGRVPPHPVWFGSNYPVYETLVASKDPGMILGSPRPGLLAIRVWKAPTILFASPQEGGLIGVPEVGSVEGVSALQTRFQFDWLREHTFVLVVVLLCTLFSLVCLLMGLRNRGRTGFGSTRLLFWLAIALAFPLESLLLTDIPGLVSFRWSYGLIADVIGLFETALWFALIDLLGLNDNKMLVRWTKVAIAILWGFDSLDGALQLFDWSRMPQQFLPWDTAFTLLAVAIEFWGVALVLFAFRRRLNAASRALAICAFAANLVQALGDLGGMGVRWTHWALYSYMTAPLLTLGGSPLDVRTITNTLLLIAILYAAWRYSAEQDQRQTALEQEYRSAREVQQRLVPVSVPSIPGFDFQAAYLPAHEVGGDFYQIFPQTEGSSLIVVGDVSGKGLTAAMKGVLALGAVRALAETCPSPAQLLNGLNREMVKAADGGFITCLCAQIYPDGRAILSTAGHPAPYLNGEELQIGGGIPLGILPNADYSETTVHLSPGQSLMLLSDGVLEATNSAGELFGFDRTAAISNQPAEEIARRAQHFGQEDDITVLTLAFAPAAH